MAPRVSSTSNRIVSTSNVTPSSQLQKTPASTTLDSIPAPPPTSNHPRTMRHNTPIQSAPIITSLQVSGTSCTSKTPHLTRPTSSSAMGGSNSSLIDTPTSVTGANAPFRKIMPRPYIDAWYARWTRRQFSPRSHLYKSPSHREARTEPRPTTAQASGRHSTSTHTRHYIEPRRLPAASGDRSAAIRMSIGQTGTTSSLSETASDEDSTDNILGTPPSWEPRAVSDHPPHTNHPVVTHNDREANLAHLGRVYATKVVTAPQKVQGPGEAAVGSPTHLSIPSMPSKLGGPAGTSKTIAVQATEAITTARPIQRQAPGKSTVLSSSLKPKGTNRTLRLRATTPSANGTLARQVSSPTDGRTLQTFPKPTADGWIPDAIAVGRGTISSLAKQKGRQTEDDTPKSSGGLAGPSRISASPSLRPPRGKEREGEEMSRKRRCLACQDRHDKCMSTGIWVGDKCWKCYSLRVACVFPPNPHARPANEIVPDKVTVGPPPAPLSPVTLGIGLKPRNRVMFECEPRTINSGLAKGLLPPGSHIGASR